MTYLVVWLVGIPVVAAMLARWGSWSQANDVYAVAWPLSLAVFIAMLPFRGLFLLADIGTLAMHRWMDRKHTEVPRG